MILKIVPLILEVILDFLRHMVVFKGLQTAEALMILLQLGRLVILPTEALGNEIQILHWIGEIVLICTSHTAKARLLSTTLRIVASRTRHLLLLS